MARAGKVTLGSLLVGNKLVFLDGAMGTMIQADGVSGYACPEELNLTHPRLIERIHASYVNAGAQIVETNTFGANHRKLARVGLQGKLHRIIDAGVAAARKAAGDRALVAGSIGPLGEFVEPVGPISPVEALGLFKEVAEQFQRAGADLLLIETMSDLKEVRAACLAARASGLPFAVTATFEADGRTVLGTPPEAAAITAESLGASLVGVNCSLGPENLLPMTRRMATVARKPLLVQPNAGLPVLDNGRTVFPMGPAQFAEAMEHFLETGVRVLGGCCGTTPDHIHSLVKKLSRKHATAIEPIPGCRLASRSSWVLIGSPYPVAVIGERVNPTGRKVLVNELRHGGMETVRRDIIDQVKAGAALLDINAGSPELDEPGLLPVLVELAQKLVNVPLVIDSVNPRALENSLMVIEGRALVNSVNASRKSLEAVLPVAARHGTALIGLAMDEKGIPRDAAARLRLAERIVLAAADHGFEPEDILIDCLAVAAGADQRQVMETLTAIRGVKLSLKAGAVLGVSNVSYGLPAREELNAAFLSMAAYCGLDAAIVNPYSSRILDAISSSMVLTGRDPGAAAYIARNAKRPGETAAARLQAPDLKEDIFQAVRLGDGSTLVKLVRRLFDEGAEPIRVNEEYLIPALEKVGDLFEKKVFFLPQMISAAEAAREAFGVVKERLSRSDDQNRGTVLLATVEGDIHDLGKNIFKSLLENYGFTVEDLGINVPPRVVAARAKKGDIRLVGLSALMTTTLPAMESTIKLIRKGLPGLPVIVGGAVLTAVYAASIGADGYAPDASQGVKLVRKLLSGGK